VASFKLFFGYLPGDPEKDVKDVCIVDVSWPTVAHYLPKMNYIFTGVPKLSL
jgi:hypothetical protein